MKYRIIERKYDSGEVVYLCQYKILFMWFTVTGCYDEDREFSSLEEAKEYIERSKYKDKIIKV